jgi:hypothetical protein
MGFTRDELAYALREFLVVGHCDRSYCVIIAVCGG